ncbi:hypothetical protein Nepgr_016272 [Nepenthes gracilis]|uniref:Zinc finger PHD-type domain-containing protein n=1 Tax=Nepenthes gracilis TaxID=150966 RepID=A0AAD3XS45_NEPGR|nr:hypothetical protein Nepgr_016272 [Nepenthes gracilis]
MDEDALTKVSSGFIVDDDDCVGKDGMGDYSDDEQELFDSVCAICDDGGDILCCEGSCFRSFHATPEAAREAGSGCCSLGFSMGQVQVMQNFRCLNCQYNQHQCFSCGELGSSDINSDTEVFRCVNATCGHYYHPICITKLLCRDNAAAAEQLEKNIAAGEKFVCPIHKCYVCGKGEDKSDPELQFAVCRRCPQSYHKKCLPRNISFEDKEHEGIIKRAWKDLLPNRILIYCSKHEIDANIRTPARDHIKFPYVEDKEIKRPSSLFHLIEKAKSVKMRLSLGATVEERIAPKSVCQIEKKSITGQGGLSDKKGDPESLTPVSKKLKGTDASRKSSIEKKLVLTKLEKSSTEESKSSLGKQLFALYFPQSDLVKVSKLDKIVNEVESTKKVNPASKMMIDSVPPLDPNSERRIMALLKDAASSITLDDIFQNHTKLASTHAYSQKTLVDRTISQGKVEGSVEAIRTALKKLDEGCTIEEAKAVCEPNVLNQIIKWKNKLRVYLAPFLYGMRYTSFGRHFTKVDKLKEIVDKIHWYVKEGDMIVDFCCGANDFSYMMKQKLEQTGKKCLYKNFDIFRPKNDFCFEKRDWMTVSPNELPPGSQLIMGLNPPFGIKAVLANKFINKALEFRPKLIILIVPPETERLDRKRPPYDLVWEDNEKLSGRSFYLPGSVDSNDKQIEDWNLVTPLLYLWSRQDWTAKHKEIAQKHGHNSGQEREFKRSSDSSPKDNRDEDGDVCMEICEDPPQDEDLKGGAAVNRRSKTQNHGHESHRSSRRSRKRRSRGKKHVRGRVLMTTSAMPSSDYPGNATSSIFETPLCNPSGRGSSSRHSSAVGRRIGCWSSNDWHLLKPGSGDMPTGFVLGPQLPSSELVSVDS